MLITDLDQFKAKPVSRKSAKVRRFYAPIDDVHGALVALLGSVRHSLILAMFGYADDALAAMVSSALQDPQIFVSVTLDKTQAAGAHERAILEKYHHEMLGNSVAIGTSERGAIMHRKMVIIDGLWLVSGSTNWSTSAATLQDNELTVAYDPVGCAEATAILAIEHDHALAQMIKGVKR